MELFGAISSLIYIWLEAKQSKIMWIIGFISSAVYVAVFAGQRLWAAAGIQLYYVFMSIYGYIQWSSDISEGERYVVHLKRSRALRSGIVAVFIFIILFLILSNFGEDPYPAADSAIAAVSIIATWWLSQRHIEQWYLWIAVNAGSALLYLDMALYPTFVLYLVYLTASVAGLLRWRKFVLTLK
jgi:nicotinamide mononucleotide transporter